VAACLWTTTRSTHRITEAALMPKRMPHSRITGPTTRSDARAAGLTDRELRHPQVARLSRDTYLPRAVRGELSSRFAAVLLTAPPDGRSATCPPPTHGVCRFRSATATTTAST
jgi:hypothetical protein